MWRLGQGTCRTKGFPKPVSCPRIQNLLLFSIFSLISSLLVTRWWIEKQRFFVLNSYKSSFVLIPWHALSRFPVPSEPPWDELQCWIFWMLVLVKNSSLVDSWSDRAGSVRFRKFESGLGSPQLTGALHFGHCLSVWVSWVWRRGHCFIGSRF